MRKDNLIQLLQVTLEQRDVLSDDNYERFIELLEVRQSLIEKIEEVNREQPLTGEEKSVLLQINEIDSQNIEEYNKQLEQAKMELKKINQLRAKNQQYINPYGLLGKGIYFDNK